MKLQGGPITGPSRSGIDHSGTTSGVATDVLKN